MRDEILTYWDMCAREHMSLQRGMNFRGLSNISVVLMSRRASTWSDRGLFCLTGHEYLRVAGRMVFKFRMRLSDVSDEMVPQDSPEEFKRVIPSWVKHVVYKRDKGRCVICGSSDQLHFDHELPFSRGGTGLTPENIRVLCARHNLEKGARIE